MTERTFRLIVGLVLLALLYFEIHYAVLALIALMTIEGVTNWRVPVLLSKVRGMPNMATASCNPGAAVPMFRYSFEAERMLRLIIAAMLILSYIVYPETLWFLPWLLAFAVLGAGVSGVCPCVLGLKKCGFR
ncbi:MAG: hypothetical protein NUV51_11975 [Sulfuricaulis sp.]|nr:hypothetical protein [Sulfuricaulis sp.]